MYLPPDMQGFSVRTFWSTISVTVPSGKNLQCSYIIQIRLLALPGFHHQLFSCSADDLIGTLQRDTANSSNRILDVKQTSVCGEKRSREQATNNMVVSGTFDPVNVSLQKCDSVHCICKKTSLCFDQVVTREKKVRTHSCNDTKPLQLLNSIHHLKIALQAKLFLDQLFTLQVKILAHWEHMNN